MSGSVLPRAPLRVGGCLLGGIVLAAACTEREPPPPAADVAPAIAPAAAESVPDTLVGDSVMARDTIPLPTP